jgi:hypothetical protein
MEVFAAVLGVRWQDLLEDKELWGDDDEAEVEGAMVAALGACVLMSYVPSRLVGLSLTRPHTNGSRDPARGGALGGGGGGRGLCRDDEGTRPHGLQRRVRTI